MLAKVLIDNISRDTLACEWGLSVWIEYREHKILLDTGTTDAFARNARAMGIALQEAEIGVLSHAHYDHSDGMDAFFAANSRARFYLRESARAKYFGKKEGRLRYIGVRKGMLKKHADRIEYVRGTLEVLPGVWLLPHSSEGLEKIAARSDLYVRRALRMRPDNFDHEQSLVFETENGLVIFNSCSHAGPDNIVSEVLRAFPGKKIHAYIGGLHLYKLNDDELRALADRMRACGIGRVYTGHCTGDRGYEVLREELGEGVQQLYSGMVIEV